MSVNVMSKDKLDNFWDSAVVFKFQYLQCFDAVG